MGVNIKELCKRIKKDSRRRLIWTLEKDVHYVSNGHWAVRFDNLPRDVLISLFSVFAKIPSEGFSMVTTRWDVEERPAVSMTKVFRDCESYKSDGTVTNIIIDYGKEVYRVIKADEYLIKINNEYMSLAEPGSKPVKCSGRMLPVSFGDNQLIIIPVRNENAKEDETIKGLLAV